LSGKGHYLWLQNATRQGAISAGDSGMAITTNVNGKDVAFTADPDTPLLWALREDLRLTGTKFGCGIGACGACSVHIDGQVVRSCQVQLGDVAGKKITTIEGLGGAPGTLSKLQAAWIEHQVPQCGYCQSGQLMAAAALLAQTPKPTDADIDAAMTNICRCGTYTRIRAAIHAVAAA
jgi:isoquinoline 1-oxidoreductase alpha subunit